ncbi:MAG TPA: class I SAM-dependent rRNA methyltransferase [Gammaproteobacteria bacterium]|nr:class I SAM-dependent rRNA methyltransferase [Gammaproteobacteria bacterium]
MELKPLRLKKHEAKRLRAGHDWVFSNEIDVAATPLTDFEPGDLVEVQAADGRTIGSGYVNPHSLIAARLMSRDPAHAPGASLLVHRLNVAVALRERIYPTPHYRLAFGESDGVPGLVVDRYGAILVVQITTAGMERMRDDVIAALEKVAKPAGILLRNDVGVRALENLPSYVETAAGHVPDEVVVEENGCRFAVAPAGGQKTGWFYDQRDNRARLARYARGARVLDLFCYLGGWGIEAAHAGAAEVVAVDSSAPALALAVSNAAANGVALRTIQAEAFDALADLAAARERFDIVVCDPPAFVRRRKDLKPGLAAYRRLYQMAMRLLDRDGLLVAASCSQPLTRELLADCVQQAARHLDRRAQWLEWGGQGPDHPVHPAMPETEYLKAGFVRVTRG